MWLALALQGMLRLYGKALLGKKHASLLVWHWMSYESEKFYRTGHEMLRNLQQRLRTIFNWRQVMIEFRRL